jgi:endonuclease YncB( thermonuclease family)
VRGWSARSALAKTAIIAAVVVVAVLAAGGFRNDLVEDGTIAVEAVIDGDTIELSSDRRVRLVQIDAPEAGESECWSDEATAELRALLPAGTRVRLARDPRLDDVDRFGRLLRYVFKDGTNVNVALVRRGAASVWFFEGDRGRYAGELLESAREAKTARRGLWGGCPRTRLDPLRAVETDR